MTITLEEALLGFKKKITHLDGRVIEVSSEDGEIIQPFSWKIIEDEGMPVHGQPSTKGELHVKFTITFPKELSDK